MNKKLSNGKLLNKAFAFKNNLKGRVSGLCNQKEKKPFLLIIETYDNVVNNNAWLLGLSEEIFEKIEDNNKIFQQTPKNTPMYVALFSDNKDSVDVTSVATGELSALVKQFSNPFYTTSSLIDMQLKRNSAEYEKEEREKKEKEKLANALKQVTEVMKNFDEKKLIEDDEVRKIILTKIGYGFAFNSIILLGALTNHNITIEYNGVHLNDNQMFKMIKEGLRPKDVVVIDKTTKQTYFKNNNLSIVVDRKKALDVLISLYAFKFQTFEPEKILSNILECCEETFKNLLFSDDKMVIVKQTEDSNPYVLKLPKETVDEANGSDNSNNEEVNNINTQEDTEDTENINAINADTLSKEAEVNEDDTLEEIKQKITNTFKRKYKIAVKHYVESQEAEKIKEGFVESKKIEDNYIKKIIRMSIVFDLLSNNSIKFDCGYSYSLKTDNLIDLLLSDVKPVNVATNFSSNSTQLMCNFGFYTITTKKENMLNAIFTILCINSNCDNIEHILSKLENDEPEVFEEIVYLMSLPDNDLVRYQDEYLPFFKKLFEFKIH